MPANLLQHPALVAALLLAASNLFMTFAWYAHLRNMQGRAWWVAALASWGIALFEYLLQVPANRIGYTVLSLGQLKIMQEVITLADFRSVCLSVHGSAAEARLRLGGDVHGGRGLLHVPRMTALRDLLASAARNAAAGRVDDALANYRGALKRSPALAEVHYNVGVLLARKGELAGAEKSLDEALRLRPSWAQAYLALGHLYFRQARYADAERSFGRAATHAPESVEALFNLATSRDRQRRWSDALPPLKAARGLAPDNEDIWFALRGHLLLFQREEEAFDDFRRFEANAALSARIVAAGLLSARIAPGIDYEEKYLPLALDWPYQSGEGAYAAVAVAQAQYFDVTREQLLRVYQAHDRVRQAERGSIADFAAPLLPAGAGERQVRIGYLSADLRSHVMGRLMLEVVRRHDTERFSVHAYSLAVREIEDEVTGAIPRLLRRLPPARRRRRCECCEADRRRWHRHPDRPDGTFRVVAPGDTAVQAGTGDHHASGQSRRGRHAPGGLQADRRPCRPARRAPVPDRGAACARPLRAAVPARRRRARSAGDARSAGAGRGGDGIRQLSSAY